MRAIHLSKELLPAGWPEPVPAGIGGMSSKPDENRSVSTVNERYGIETMAVARNGWSVIVLLETACKIEILGGPAGREVGGSELGDTKTSAWALLELLRATRLWPCKRPQPANGKQRSGKHTDAHVVFAGLHHCACERPDTYLPQ